MYGRKTLLLFIAIIVGVTYSVQTWRAFTNCNVLNQSRRESQYRATVLKDFLESAASAREESAAGESDPIQKSIDLNAAAKYRADMRRIHDLRPVSCTL
jgi:hypothetical protein